MVSDLRHGFALMLRQWTARKRRVYAATLLHGSSVSLLYAHARLGWAIADVIDATAALIDGDRDE